ncbi:MAG TPA: hypothetical protein PLE30_11290 [Candidatus Kapabacteria bacterium]|nr:hypothetical protein [Candidatus Kapabacteria bacterium]
MYKTLSTRLIFIIIIALGIHEANCQVESLEGPKGGAIYDIAQYGDSLYILRNNQIYTLVDDYWTKSYFFDIEPNIYSFKFYDDFIYLLSDKGLYLFDRSQNKLTTILENEFIQDFLKIEDTCFIATTSKFYKSIDNFFNFEVIDKETNQYYQTITNWIYKNQKLYTGFASYISGDPIKELGIYVSENMGLTWKKLTQNLNYNSFSCMIEIDSLIIVAPIDDRLYYTTNNGEDWDFFKNFDQKFIKSIILQNNKLVVGTEDGKIFVSDDFGENWTESQKNSYLTNIKEIQFFEGKYYLISSNGVFVSHDASYWSTINEDLSFCDVMNVDISKNKLYVSTYNSGFFEYDIDNQNWNNIFSLQEKNSFNKSITNDSIIVISPYYSNSFYLSQNYGKDWIVIDSLKNYTKSSINDIDSFSDTLIIFTSNSIYYFNTNNFDFKKLNFGTNFLKNPNSLLRVDGGFYLVSLMNIYTSEILDSNWKKTDIPLNSTIDLKLHKNKLYFLTYQNGIYQYDIASKSLIQLEKTSSDTLNGIKIYRNYIFALASNDNKLYYSKIDTIKWNYLDFDSLRTFVRTFDFYNDNVIMGTNNQSVLIQKLDFLNSTSVEEVELLPYFYAYPPFPIPGNNQIKTLMYFEPNIVINKSDIGIYDQNGNKIERDENINIDYLNNYSGYLIWECKNTPNGIYFIHLKFGETFKTIKVIVNKQ